MSSLNTPRLVLRPASWGDAWIMAGLIGDPDVRRYLGGAVPLRQRVSVIRRYLNPGPQAWLWCVRRQDGVRLGLVFLAPHDQAGDLELSYQFHPKAWGQGYALEATRAVCDHASDDLGAARVLAETQAANGPSCQLLARLSMKEIDRFQRFGTEQVLFST